MHCISKNIVSKADVIGKIGKTLVISNSHNLAPKVFMVFFQIVLLKDILEWLSKRKN